MSILFATDLSSRASGAGDVAARLARALGDRLIVAHVAERGNRPATLDAEVDRLSAIVRTTGELTAATTVVKGIEDAIAVANPRLVVVGAQGAGERPFLGSVASTLAVRVAMPLLVVRSARHLVRFLDEKRELSALVTEAFDDTFPPARDALIELARLGPIHAVVGHWSFGLDDPASTKKKRDLQMLLVREMTETLREVPGARVELLVRDGFGRLDAQVCDLARERDTDLVICGTHQRRMMERVLEGSVALGIVRDAPCSVLVAPASMRAL